MQAKNILHHNFQFTIEQARAALASMFAEIPAIGGEAYFRLGEKPGGGARCGILTVAVEQEDGQVLENNFYLDPFEIRDALIKAGNKIPTEGALWVNEWHRPNGPQGVMVRVSVEQ